MKYIYVHGTNHSIHHDYHKIDWPFDFFRAHLLDAKSLSVYGVYMPRTNPQGIFMTGHATQRSRDKGHTIPAVPPGILLLVRKP